MRVPLQPQNTTLWEDLAFGAGLCLLALAPLFRGGNRSLPLIGLEWLGLLVLWLLTAPWLLCRHAGVQAQGAGRLSGAEGVLMLSPLWAALLFLTPLPMALWAALPGHGLYGHVLEAPAWRPASLMPDATAASLLAGIPVVAAFALSRTAPPARLRTLAPALVLMALVQAVWGLLQAGALEALYFEAEFSGGLIGSFANANHFANYIAMTLPLAVFLLWQALSGPRAGQRPAAVMAWSLTLLVLLATVLACGSRTGAVAALLVTLLAVLVLGRLRASSRRWPALACGGLLLAALLAGGVNSLVLRLNADHLEQDASFRWQLAVSSWKAALAFWPLGAGPGSFAGVYPRFQPSGLDVFVEHAHNDYVQLLMELGALFVALAGLAGWLILRQGLALWRQARLARRGRGAAVQLQLCCALGVLALLVHSWVDFNLRIPANAMLCACLLGVFLRPVCSAS